MSHNDNIQEWFSLFDRSDIINIEEIAGVAYSRLATGGPAIYPARENVFKAFELTGPGDVKVVILGQDPYHTPDQAQGLAFSLPDSAPTQPSMRNILKELESDVGVVRTSQDLTSWAEQGVLLLNTALTVEEGKPGSMMKLWKKPMEQIISCLAELPQTIVFVLWGKHAQQYTPLIEGKKAIVASAHPSPFSARRGFFNSKPFSKVNDYLVGSGVDPVQWGL